MATRFGTSAGLAVVAALGALASGGGCGKADPGPPATVRGTVTFQGKPLAGGLIVFAPDREKGNAARQATAAVGPDGTYRLVAAGGTAIAPGWYRVAISDAAGAMEGGFGVPFPAALRRPDQSGIEREVHVGVDNVIPFEIEVAG